MLRYSALFRKVVELHRMFLRLASVTEFNSPLFYNRIYSCIRFLMYIAKLPIEPSTLRAPFKFCDSLGRKTALLKQFYLKSIFIASPTAI